MSTGIEELRVDYIYENCILGRQVTRPYNSYLPRGRYKIDVIYVDVAHSLIELFDRYRYFVSIIDNFT